MKINLSYSTLNMVYTCPHNYLNKQMGIKQPENKYFENGKRLHRIIQDHVAFIKRDERLSHIRMEFPIVETIDFDPKCKIEFKIDDKYDMIGYFDGLNSDNFKTLEIKTSSKKWSMNDFQKAVQRKIYSLALPMIKSNVLIYAHSDDSLWHVNKPKVFEIPVHKSDIGTAWNWIREGVYRLEHIGDSVKKELEPTGGKCQDIRCYYGTFCQFK